MIEARDRLGLVAIAAALTMTMTAAPASAGCDLDLGRLLAWRGSMAPGARCGSLVIATDAAATSKSQGRVVIPTAIPYTLAVVARRLSADGDAPIELELGGGYFMWRDGGWSIYFDEVQFARDGWHPLPGLDSRRDHRVVMERTVDGVAVTFDGVLLGRWPVSEHISNGPSIVLTGRRGARSRLLVRELSFTALSPR